jgi:hypothetical protein
MRKFRRSVRRADPVRVERLADEAPELMHAPGRVGSRLGLPPQVAAVTDTSRDFRALYESAEPRPVAGNFLQHIVGRAAVNASGPGAVLGKLFAPPVDLLHVGSLDSARAVAMARGVWLLVSLLRQDEFDALRMNRVRRSRRIETAGHLLRPSAASQHPEVLRLLARPRGGSPGRFADQDAVRRPLLPYHARA